MHKLGLIVNPIAGIGGRAGLKGSDGEEIVRKAIELGAGPVAPKRAMEALRGLLAVKSRISLFTYPHEMGEDEAKEVGFSPNVVGKIITGHTTADDTKRAARELRDLGVDLILFAGGDGTARDICEAVGNSVPVVGIPAGVKMHSAVFAVDPSAAAGIIMKFLWGELPLREAEVMDIDEEAYRQGRLSAKLYGYLLTPYEPNLVQGVKEASWMDIERDQQAAIAKYIVEEMKPDVVYILGPGTTTKAVSEELGIQDSTLLGVDLVHNYKLLARDVNERQILRAIEGKSAVIIVSPIGGQGFIFGRGNQQISPEVIRRVGKNNIWVLATPQKLMLTPTFRVDTGDAELDRELRGYIRTITGYRESRMVRVG
jgi:predicted polyphosphate/ATP-dependent NAD kinase